MPVACGWGFHVSRSVARETLSSFCILLGVGGRAGLAPVRDGDPWNGKETTPLIQASA